jgi:hypothetical protein
MVRTRNVLILAVTMFVVAGCGVALGGKPNWWSQQEHTSDAVAEAAVKAVPFPLNEVKAGGFLERKNLRERLIRFSKPDKIGYLYLMSFGKFVGYYTIKGKISSTKSQLTNTNQTWDCRGHGGDCFAVVDSVGDDGSFGPNEDAVFFFTTNGTMVQTPLDYVYSDQPLNVNVPNLLK